MTYLRKILKYALPYRLDAINNVVFNALYALFSTLSFLAFIPMLDILFGNTKRIHTAPDYSKYDSTKNFLQDFLNFRITSYIEAHQNGEVYALGIICFVIVLLFFFKNVSSYLASFFIINMRNGVVKDIRNALYEKVVNLPIAYFTEKRKGDIMARLSSDVYEVERSFLMILELIVRDPLTIIFTLIAMITISAKLTAFIFIILPLTGLMISIIGKKLRRDSTKAQKENAFFFSIIEETLTGLKIIKGFTAEDTINEKFENSTSKLYKLSNSMMRKRNLASPISEFFGVAVISLILWYGGKMVLVDKTISGATFITFLTLAYNILTPVKSISKAIATIKNGNASAIRILEVLETKNPIIEEHNPVEKTNFTSEIKLENISFKYKDDYVLKDFSLTIPKGKTVALVGQSGSGKSTLANLVPRFYDVHEGSISIDGINVKELSKKSLRSLMGIVTQDAILFNDSVANNIALPNPNATLKDIQNAAVTANAHEFIKDLPQTYQTNIGDAGNTLSGGQKQRLSIARAILKNSPIMILDEATSALDTESEKLVQDALERVMKNRTSLVIAHRLSTIQNADLIVVMKKGRILEQGKHQELLSKKGEYYKLVTMQSL